MDRRYIPACGGLRTRVLREWRDGPLDGHLGTAKTGVACAAPCLVGGAGRRRREDVRTTAEHSGPRCLLYPLPLPSRRGRMIGVEWTAGLPTTEGGFDMMQKHVGLLSEKVRPLVKQ